jgi:protein-tyrosine phosphatase
LGGKGITPIITHPERHPLLQKSLTRVLEWAEQGCAIQVTGSALRGSWGEHASKAAKWLLEREAVHVLATDAHGTKHRAPVLSLARDVVAEIAGAEVARALVEDNPRAIVSGEPLPYFRSPAIP